MNFNKINDEVSKFVNARNWDKYHSPKNLSMALSVEASELVEIFQWKNDQNISDTDKNKVEDEIADIFFYLIRLSQKMNIDIEKSFYKKLEKNKIKYPLGMDNTKYFE
ncbi:MAG: nucleotide pyrophosphohydrolase [Candidatus Fonsibacter sp.]|jgi:dCTP diphosphatase|nr:nucleotide pyrophosphohydrolase [Pelagibacterales bacterium]